MPSMLSLPLPCTNTHRHTRTHTHTHIRTCNFYRQVACSLPLSHTHTHAHAHTCAHATSTNRQATSCAQPPMTHRIKGLGCRAGCKRLHQPWVGGRASHTRGDDLSHEPGQRGSHAHRQKFHTEFLPGLTGTQAGIEQNLKQDLHAHKQKSHKTHYRIYMHTDRNSA